MKFTVIIKSLDEYLQDRTYDTRKEAEERRDFLQAHMLGAEVVVSELDESEKGQ